jgi:hypothetical protein
MLRSCKVAATTLAGRYGGGPAGVRWRLSGGIIDKGRPVRSFHFQVDLSESCEVGRFARRRWRAFVAGSEVVGHLSGRKLQEPARPMKP